MTSLLEQAQAEGTPLLTGDLATFVWQGAEAQLVGDFNHWSMEMKPIAMRQVEPDVWAVTVQIPSDAYSEYRFVVNGEFTADPLNKRQSDDGMGHSNSFFWMPDGIDNPLAQEQPNVPKGQVTQHILDGKGFVVDGQRTVHFYQPPVDQPVPLLVVFDGSGYLHKAKLATIVDNLIAQGRIQPVAMALVDPGGQGRVVEYACSDATTAFIIKCVLLEAQKHLKLIDINQSPGTFGIMGASMGGLMSMYIAHRAPEIFGHVLCESGAFGSDHLYYRSVLYDLIRYAPKPNIKIWMDAGVQEWFIKPNREIVPLLKERGYDMTYVEHTSGHNYPSWRNILWRGLEHLYGRT
ncbi:MAG: esterase family protein [Anaerolineaceae bacterium]|nr:esterase family protein [Anaerolineaceae bacterium]